MSLNDVMQKAVEEARKAKADKDNAVLLPQLVQKSIDVYSTELKGLQQQPNTEKYRTFLEGKINGFQEVLTLIQCMQE